MKKVIIAGASGMVGSLVIEKCLNSPEISQVISLVRKPTINNHPKLKEVVVNNFSDYSSQTDRFENVDAAFFCIGVYAGQVSNEQFREITIDYAVSFANTLKEKSPSAKFCFLSGAGADRSEKSTMAFAKFKGIAENKIAALAFPNFYTFRPGFIYPVKPRKEPNMMYQIGRWLYPIMKLLGSGSIKSTELASAIFNVGLNGAKLNILENEDIIKLREIV